MTTTEIESTIRKFMVEELMIEQAEAFELDDQLELDSLDQTELRVFLNETYKIDMDVKKVPDESIRTLKSIVSLIN
jgi:acyl carrier protein